MNLLIRKFLYNFFMLFVDEHEIEKRVKLIVKYDPLNVLTKEGK